jgi:hypothetical protein
MAVGDASSADMRRAGGAAADPLALDEDTVERLLTGALPPAQSPSGYAEVARLLAAAAAPPHPSELTGGAAALAELRAVARTRRRVARTRRAERRSRRRRVGLAVVMVTGALATGGAAALASGHLPGPVRDAARSILATVGAEPTTPTPPPSAPGSTGAGSGLTGAGRPEPSGSTGPAGAGPVPGPGREGLCQAYLASRDHRGKNMDAAAFRLLAEAAGGSGEILAYCQDTPPGKAEPTDTKQQTPAPDDPGQGQGPGGSDGAGAGTVTGNQGQGGPPSTRRPR